MPVIVFFDVKSDSKSKIPADSERFIRTRRTRRIHKDSSKSSPVGDSPTSDRLSNLEEKKKSSDFFDVKTRPPLKPPWHPSGP
jgi:hypothetical protein